MASFEYSKRVFYLAATLLVLTPAVVTAAEKQEERGYIIKDYRYDPDGSGGDAEAGHSLCASRCNALSFDFSDYLMADGREFHKVAVDVEMTVPLDNPFLKGNCICTVDEYRILPKTRNQTKK